MCGSPSRPPRPGIEAPQLTLTGLKGQPFRPSGSGLPFTALHFYRGAFCSVCRRHLEQLDQHTDQLHAAGIEPVVASVDSLADARAMASDLGIERLSIGCEAPIAELRQWGLFISEGGNGRPPMYCEPGTFVIREDQTLYWVSVQSLPWGSPRPADILEGMRFMSARDFGLRGAA